MNRENSERHFTHQTAHVSFFGHTHVAGYFIQGDDFKSMDGAEGSLYLNINERSAINVGSVGQPRDGNWQASYVIYDSDENTVQFRRVGYDVKLARARIRDARLPETLALRLIEAF
jgi:diadenosine tetraphosphatase ApaH/serine/threonine PP2A family protein phosphatase